MSEAMDESGGTRVNICKGCSPKSRPEVFGASAVASLVDKACNDDAPSLRASMRGMKVGELCILRCALEDGGDARDPMQAMKITSWVEDELHGRASAAPCWPAERKCINSSSTGLGEEELDNLKALPIIMVDEVNAKKGMTSFDKMQLCKALEEHSWAALRLPESGDGDDAAKILSSGLEECCSFFRDVPEEDKRRLVEVPGGDTCRRGAGYKRIADREQFHMASRGWGSGSYWGDETSRGMRDACEEAYGFMEAISIACLDACCPSVGLEMKKLAAESGPVGDNNRGWDASVLDAFKYDHSGARDCDDLMLGDHLDPGLFTMEACPEAMGLEVYDTSGREGGRWVRAEAVLKPGRDVILIPGEQLERASTRSMIEASERGENNGSVIPACWHRVRGGDGGRAVLVYEMRQPYLDDPGIV